MGTIAEGERNKMLDAWAGRTAYTANAAVYVKLHIGDPGAAGTANAAANTTRQQAVFPAGAIIAASGTATHADSSAGITGADSGSSSSSGDGTSGSAFPSSTSSISAGDGGSTMFGAIG